jgi:hypothetical protein
MPLVIRGRVEAQMYRQWSEEEGTENHMLEEAETEVLQLPVEACKGFQKLGG